MPTLDQATVLGPVSAYFCGPNGIGLVARGTTYLQHPRLRSLSILRSICLLG